VKLADVIAMPHQDSWWNALLSIGTNFGRTKYDFVTDARLPDQTLSDLYHGDAFAARICDSVPKHALRQGFTIATGDEAVDSAIGAKLDDLGARAKLLETWTWANVFGGAVLFAGADDGKNPREPLDWNAIRSVRFLTVLDKRELYPSETYNDPLSSRFGEPSIYRITRTGGNRVDTREVHASRLIRFDGTLTDRQRKQQNNGWSESELQRVYDKLQTFNGAYSAVGTLLQDSSQAVFKIKNLMSLIIADKNDYFKKRMQVMDMVRSVGRAIMIDADGEDFERKETTLTGIPDTLDKFLLLLAGASGKPVTVLMGQSPAGMNATGESDIRSYYDNVKAEQSHTLKPNAEVLARMVLRAKDGPTRGVEPANWSMKFPSLWTPTQIEEANLKKTVADMDAIYITNQVVTPAEVALSRFRKEGWSADMAIDFEVREAAQEADRVAAEQVGVPSVPNEMPAAGPT
jgi:uncharacterized protein